MTVEKWKVAGNYVTGVSHKESNTVCQDRIYSLVKNGVQVIALSDGAGSKKLSHFGAEIVTKKICELITDNFFEFLILLEKEGIDSNQHANQTKKLKKKILDELQNELIKFSIENGVDYSDLSSTLLFFAYKDDYYIQGHIGDGAIGVIYKSHDNEYVTVMSKPENGAQSNITYFVTNPDANEHLRIEGGIINDLYGVILMSDGPSELLYHDDKGFDENTYKIFKNFNKVLPNEYNNILKRFLEETVSKYSEDDLSVILLYKEQISKNEKTDEVYLNYLFSNIHNETQIIQESKYCYFLNDAKIVNDIKFKNAKDVMEYLEWIT